MIGQRANFTTGPDWLGIHKIPVKPSGLTPFKYTLDGRRNDGHKHVTENRQYAINSFCYIYMLSCATLCTKKPQKHDKEKFFFIADIVFVEMLIVK